MLAADPGMKLPSISLSHSGNSVAAAASWHAVPGIDIQVMDRDRDYAALAAHMGWIPSLGARRTWRRGSRFNPHLDPVGELVQGPGYSTS